MEAADAVFAHMRSLGIEGMCCLGDVVGYGPDPAHCADLIRGHADFTVMGNHDEALFHGAEDFNPHAAGYAGSLWSTESAASTSSTDQPGTPYVSTSCPRTGS